MKCYKPIALHYAYINKLCIIIVNFQTNISHILSEGFRSYLCLYLSLHFSYRLFDLQYVTLIFVNVFKVLSKIRNFILTECVDFQIYLNIEDWDPIVNKIEAYHDISFNSKMDKFFNLDESIFV